MSTDEFLQAILDLDDDMREALLEVLKDNPDDLQQALGSLGYDVGQSDESPANDDWTLIDDKQEETDTASPTSQPTDLTRAEQALYEYMSTVDTPSTASEVKESIQEERQELVEQYTSFNNRGWISSNLSTFAKKGYIGKYRDGREMLYTADITKAIRNWALKNQVAISDLSEEYSASDIAAETGMNRDAVAEALRRLQ